MRVQVSDGRGGFAVTSRDLFGGPNELLFGGIVVDRITGAPVAQAQVSLNRVPASTDAQGRFTVKVPDASRFVLNIRKPGYALSSRIYYGRNTGLHIQLDRTSNQPLDAGKGGVLTLPCGQRQDQSTGNDCDPGVQVSFGANILVDSQGKPYTGPAIVEGLRYDTALPDPIPGDQGGTFGGKSVRLATYGALFLQPRDVAGNPLQLALGATVSVSMPIEAALRTGAPASIPFFRYDEDSGMWLELGTLTRSGDRYQGKIRFF